MVTNELYEKHLILYAILLILQTEKLAVKRVAQRNSFEPLLTQKFYTMAFIISILIALGVICSPADFDCQFFDDNPEMHEIIILGDYETV